MCIVYVDLNKTYRPYWHLHQIWISPIPKIHIKNKHSIHHCRFTRQEAFWWCLHAPHLGHCSRRTSTGLLSSEAGERYKPSRQRVESLLHFWHINHPEMSKKEKNRRAEEIKGEKKKKKRDEGEARGHLCALPPCITKQPMMDE